MMTNCADHFLEDFEPGEVDRLAGKLPVPRREFTKRGKIHRNRRNPGLWGAATTTGSAPAFDPSLTGHATTRCNQRGIKKDIIDLVVANFDRDYETHDGATAISISRERLAELEGEGVPRALIGRASRTVLIVSADGAIITAMNSPTWSTRFPHGTEKLRHWRAHRRGNRSRFRR